MAPTNSHWTRDWGPHYVFNEEGVGGIADPYFDGYPWVPGCFSSSTSNGSNTETTTGGGEKYILDNAVNAILANNFACPLISLPIYLTGGNVMVDGRQTAIVTRQMLDENFPQFTEEQFRQIAADSLGITNFIIVDNPEVNGIQHIDCYAKFLDEETILVKKVPGWHPEYMCCEALAIHLADEKNAYGEPYNIVRIYCGVYSGNNAAAYTNSLILNKKVLVPLFGIPEDQQALQVYEQAMPGYEVIGFQWSAWYHYDALHCRVMGIFDREMLRIEHKPLRGELWFEGLPALKVRVDARSGAGLIAGSQQLLWRAHGDLNWNAEPLLSIPETDSLMAYLPAETGVTYEYYIAASDSSGRSEHHPRTAPLGFHTFTYAGNTTGIALVNPEESLSVYPVVFHDKTLIRLYNTEPGSVLSIWTTSGIKVREWSGLNDNSNLLVWDGKNQNGSDLSSGMYIIVLSGVRSFSMAKCILVR
jgi:agmatine deiminase